MIQARFGGGQDKTIDPTGINPTTTTPAKGEPAGNVKAADAGNVLLTTVGGTANIIQLQKDYTSGSITRDMGINSAVVLFGLNEADAIKLFPELNIALAPPKTTV